MYQYMILKFGTIFIAICENHENAGHSPLCVGRKVFSTGHIVTELLSQLLRILKFSLNINFVQRLVDYFKPSFDFLCWVDAEIFQCFTMCTFWFTALYTTHSVTLGVPIFVLEMILTPFLRNQSGTDAQNSIHLDLATVGSMGGREPQQ